MTKNKKFSDLVTEFTHMWISWMKYNAICKDENLSIEKRKNAADECEKLIDKRYTIIEQLDAFFS